MTEFTPGPWKLEIYEGHTDMDRAFPGRIRAGDENIYGGPFSFKALRGRTNQEALANARLIAAAPALYAALEKAEKVFCLNSFLSPSQAAVAEQARAALAAARGDET